MEQRIIHDNLCAEVFTSADAERIVLGCRDEDDVDQLDNDIEEPGNDAEEGGVYLGLIGAPKGWFHSSPIGARVVPADQTGKKQCINSWEFYYQNWKAEKFD